MAIIAEQKAMPDWGPLANDPVSTLQTRLAAPSQDERLVFPIRP
jgi:hypothetical protein